MERVLVTGAGGFIGTWLVRHLKEKGYWVRGADLKRPEWSETAADEFWVNDLRYSWDATQVVKEIDWVFDLAADMGGIGFLATHDADMILHNTMINLNVVHAAYQAGVKRYFFSSSACVYNVDLQQDCEDISLKEADVFPSSPDGGYGWQKLFHELICKFLGRDYDFETRVARFHNIYGQFNPWRGGREKAPAALCRKVAIAKLSGNPIVEIWGDGQQRRSFMYVDDCIEGMLRLMKSDFPCPLNLGRDRGVTIDELVDIIADIAEIKVEKKYIKGPQGVRSRNSDNSLCKKVLGWAPSIPLEEGLVPTYKWIENQVMEKWNEM